MASIERRGPSWRTVWRYDGVKQYTTWPEQHHAARAKALAEAHQHRISADEVERIILGEDTPRNTPTGPTYRQWCERLLPARTSITPATLAGYRRQLDLRILPALGDLIVAPGGIRPTDIGLFLAHLREVGLKNTTITRYFSLIHGTLAAAVREGLLDGNPCDGVDFQYDQVADDDTGEEDHVYLTPDEYRLLRAAFPPADRPLLDLLAGTGARWSEATALAVEHVVTPKGNARPKIRIWRAWKRDGKGGRYLGATKGRSKRDLPISLSLYRELAPLVEGQPDGTLLFRNMDGSELDYDTFYRTRWRPALLAASRCAAHPPPPRERHLAGARGRCGDHGGVREDGKPCRLYVIPGLTRCPKHCGPAPDAVSTCVCEGVLRVRPTPHDLRHTHAAWLFSDPRMTPLAVSRRLGHKQLSTTSEIYGGLMPQAEEMAVDALDDLLGTGEEPQG